MPRGPNLSVVTPRGGLIRRVSSGVTRGGLARRRPILATKDSNPTSTGGLTVTTFGLFLDDGSDDVFTEFLFVGLPPRTPILGSGVTASSASKGAGRTLFVGLKRRERGWELFDGRASNGFGVVASPGEIISTAATPFELQLCVCVKARKGLMREGVEGSERLRLLEASWESTCGGTTRAVGAGDDVTFGESPQATSKAVGVAGSSSGQAYGLATVLKAGRSASIKAGEASFGTGEYCPGRGDIAGGGDVSGCGEIVKHSGVGSFGAMEIKSALVLGVGWRLPSELAVRLLVL